MSWSTLGRNTAIAWKKGQTLSRIERYKQARQGKLRKPLGVAAKQPQGERKH